MTIRCAIIDDDVLAINILKSYLEKTNGLELVFAIENPLEGERLLLENKIDLLFLDIEMPQLTGLEFIHTILHPPKVILTSAKKEYAAEGFDLEVLDYIVKPVTFQRFSKSIKKYFAAMGSDGSESKQQPLTENEFIFLKENKKMVKVSINNILYVESIKDYIKVHTLIKTVITKEQISQFADLLPSDKFLRVHRSYLVALNKIDAYSASSIEIKDVEIPIGRNYKDECLKILGDLKK
ncbi:MAG: response regulator transcription factor [Salinivirgaceae bacterium]|nr:response regulator transcription factor [Salinivirgaceae bacterium]